MNVREYFGDIDIYLFDQIQKDRFQAGSRILDAGCGGGRNLVYFLREGFDVYGVDGNEDAIHYVRELANAVAPRIPKENFQFSTVEKMPFEDANFDVVISSAVLHFASGIAQFNAMLDEMWRVLKPGGILFARLASDIGIERLVEPVGDHRYFLPDGSERFLVNLTMLNDATARLGGQLIEPIKTTNVQNLRCMTTWVLAKQ